MKSSLKHPFFRFTLITGLYLIPAGRVIAQNFEDWPVTHIAAGGNHTLFTRADGTVFVMGDNTYGQLGLGPTVANVNVPTALTNGVGLIAAGYGHSLMVRGHTLWAMGHNNHGQLGDGTTNNHYFPEQVYSAGTGFNAGSINALSAGWYHSLFSVFYRNFSGGLWTMGDNEAGQLGDGTYIDHLTPEEVQPFSTGLPGITAVAGGVVHSLFIKSDNTLWSMGDNFFGESGLGEQAGNSNTNKPTMVENLSGFQPFSFASVAAGGYSSLFIATNGWLWAMGDNRKGQLGMPLNQSSEYVDVYRGDPTIGPGYIYRQFGSNNVDVIAVAAGGDHTLFILSDTSLWAMGDNTYGQLGVGGDYFYTDEPQMIASNVVAVAGGYGHSLFIKSDGSLWAMGYSVDGQLGTGDYMERDTPVEIVAPPPQISIIPYGDNVILAWPSNAAAFVLQSTTSLTSPNWITATPGPVIVGDQCEEFHPVSAPQLYYRLVLNP
jgi:alpha-tubulin suppressor-like RCC1 family protein